jgi:hypothetical protein
MSFRRIALLAIVLAAPLAGCGGSSTSQGRGRLRATESRGATAASSSTATAAATVIADDYDKREWSGESVNGDRVGRSIRHVCQQ